MAAAVCKLDADKKMTVRGSSCGGLFFLQQKHKFDCTDLVFCHGSVDDATSEKRMEESAMCSRRRLAVCVYRDYSSAKGSYHRRRGGFSLGRERSKYVVVRRGYFQGSERPSFMAAAGSGFILAAWKK